MQSGKIVTVFGSSRLKENNDEYKQAFHLGSLLAQAGFTVCNGGYMGAMEASARGTKSVNGKTIGITTEAFKDRLVSPWIDEEIKSDNYIDRLGKLIEIADAFIVLKGGVGTLSEFSLVWCLNVIGEIHKPVILIGNTWKKCFREMQKYLIISYKEFQNLTLVDSPESAVEILKRLMP